MNDRQPKLLDAGPSERGWHRLESAIRCLRLYAYEQIAGIRFPISPPLVNGSLLHIGLAHLYRRRQATQNGEDPSQWFEPHEAVKELSRRNAHESPLWEAGVDVVLPALGAYEARWRGEDWKVLAVEEQLRAHVGEGKHLYTQRPDLIVESAQGRVFIIDHKSCYRITSKTLRQHILDGQFLGYQLFGHQLYGPRFGGVVVNRVMLSAPYGFDRTSVEPAPKALGDFTSLISTTEERIANCKDKEPDDYPPAFSNQTCWGKYGQCHAYEICRFGQTNMQETV